MEDQESDHERYAVGRQVEALGEQDLLGPVQTEMARLGVRHLAGQGQNDADTDRDRPERQGFPE
jgi:hypothetical protein